MTGEVKTYTVAVGHIDPFNEKSVRAVEYIKKLKGLLGVHSEERGTLLLFKSEKEAKKARKKLNNKGIITGCNIYECFIDKKYADLTV